MKEDFPRVPYGMTVHENSEIEAEVDVLKTSSLMGPKTKDFENEISRALQLEKYSRPQFF